MARDSDASKVAETRFMAVTKSQFINNAAGFTGGAVFTNSPETLHVDCDFELMRDEAGAQPGAIALSRPIMPGIVGNAFLCNETWFGNRADNDQGGDVAATTATAVRVCKTTSNYCVNGGEILPIYNHSSGQELEPLNVELQDAFGKLAYQLPDMLIRIEEQSTNVSLSGQLIEQAAPNTSFTLIRLSSMINTTHNLSLSFDPSILSGAVIEVQVRSCLPGEVVSADGERCSSCGEDLYSFDPSGACKACPADAKCANAVVAPEDNFWHSSSQSIQIHKCLNKAACKYDDREDTLKHQARIAHATGAVLKYINNSNYRLCSEVRGLTHIINTL